MIWRMATCIGDSLTSGSRADAGWPELLNLAWQAGAEYLNGHRSKPQAPDGEWVGINHGIAGQTSAQILSRVPKILEEFRVKSSCAIFMMGANDARDMVSVRTAVSCFRSSLVLAEAYSYPALALIPPPFLTGVGHLVYGAKAAARWEEIRVAQLDAAASLNVPSLDLATVFDSADYYADGVHFNSEGQWKVALAVAVWLRTL